MTIQAWWAAIARAGEGWSDLSDQLDGAAKNLTSEDTGELGPRVAPVAARLIAHWQQRTETLQQAAQDHADALDEAMIGFQIADRETVAELQSLVAWDDRDAGTGAV